MRLPALKALWRKEWLALSRDRFGLGAIFVMPAVFILVMSLALRDTLRPNGSGPQLAYAVVDLDDSNASRELVELLAGQSFLRATAFGATEASTREAIAAGRLPFAVLIPRGFAARLEAELGTPDLVTLRLDPTVAALARSAFRQHLQGALGTLKARSFLRSVDPMFEGAAATLNPQTMQGAVTEEAIGNAPLTVPPTAVQQTVPAWLIFGMFFVVLPITAIFITERQQGTLQRQRSMGIGHGTMLAGKLIPFMGVNMIQTVLMLSVGVWLVPRFGGEALALPRAIWPLLAAMALAISFAAVSWALLVATLVRTTEQATVVGGVGNILMGALGGVMVPRFVMPAEMRALTNLSPMSWGLDGFHAVMLRGEGWHGLAPMAIRLVLFAVVSLTLASWLAQRKG
jgi:ABC-2 type transport system permease protein